MCVHARSMPRHHQPGPLRALHWLRGGRGNPDMRRGCVVDDKSYLYKAVFFFNVIRI